MTKAISSSAPASLVELNDRWHHLAKTKPPRSADLHFDALVSGHPGLGLLEPAGAEGEEDFLVVQIGPEHEQRTSRDITRMLVSKVLPPSIAGWALKVYRETMEARHPRYIEMLSGGGLYGAAPLDCCRLILPLFDEEGKPTQLLDSWVWRD